MKKLLSVLLAVMMAVTGISAFGINAFAEEVKNGWQHEELVDVDEDTGETYHLGIYIWYYYKNGTPVTGWQKINNKWYYFDEDGWMMENMVFLDDQWDIYAADKNGVMVKGWFKESYEDEDTGETNTYWYYFKSNGKAALGWQKIGGKWYYFDEGFGVMYADGVEEIGGKYYYFGKSGALATGWKKLNGYWYYFTTNGAAKGWTKISGKWYYFKPLADGDIQSMSIGWEKIGGKWYYFNKDGSMKTGWLKNGGAWYYFNSSGVMVTGKQKIDGKNYTFDKNGKLQNSSNSTSSSKTVYITKTGKHYHYDNHCNGGTYYESTLADAKARGLTPCSKCAK